MKLKKLIFPIILILCIVIACLYIHVSGSEIEHVSDINEYCSVTLSRYENLKWEHRTEVVLDADEAETLKNILLNSSFTRTFGSYVRFYDEDMFDIIIDFGDGQRHITMTVLGNEYIVISDQFGGHHLKIRNDDFKKSLNELINNHLLKN